MLESSIMPLVHILPSGHYVTIEELRRRVALCGLWSIFV